MAKSKAINILTRLKLSCTFLLTMSVFKSSADLGLPIEYQLYPEYFDSPQDMYNNSEKNIVVEQLLRKYNAQTVLDMTCGTGAQPLYLAQQRYTVVGSDFSPDLIKQAKEKAKKLGLDIRFLDGDMRTVKLGQFDAVITIDNAVGHLVQSDLESAIHNIAQNLKDSGIYIFDILNLEALTDEVLKADSEKVSDSKVAMDGAIISTVRRSSIYRDLGYVTSEEDIAITKDGAEKQFTNTSTLKIYTMEQLRDILTRNGFEVIEQYKIDAYTFAPAETGYSIMTVARKSKIK